MNRPDLTEDLSGTPMAVTPSSPSPNTEAPDSGASQTTSGEIEAAESPDSARLAGEAGNELASPAVEIDYPEEEIETEPVDAPLTDPATGATAARLGTASLTKLLKEHPELAQAIDAQPRMKAQLYQMARRSQELGQYQDLMPSLTSAREAVHATNQLQQFDQAYYGNDPQQFWNRLYAAQLQPDPANGQLRSSGAYERNVQYLHRLFLDRVEQQALRDRNGDLTGAVRSFRDALGWNPTQSSPALEGEVRSSAAQEAAPHRDLPPHIRQKLEEAERNARELEQLRLRRSEDERRQSETFLSDTTAEVATELRTFVNGLLSNAKLSDYDKQNIARDFIEAVSKLAGQDKVHLAALDDILRAGGNTSQTRARMVARSKAWARHNGRDILEPILARVGASLQQRQSQRDDAKARLRTEPAVAGAPANPKSLSARDLVQAAEAKLKRRLSDREILELA